jgi:1-deoxy-D-xylulose-5-phosphate reductoisomerase
LAQLGAPDMRIPISYCLGWPARLDSPTKNLDLTEVSQLDFFAPDAEKFPALRLTREALHMGGTAPTILNAANEVAVFAFLEGRVGFLDIAKIVEKTLSGMETTPLTCLEMVHAIDGEARVVAQNVIEGL